MRAANKRSHTKTPTCRAFFSTWSHQWPSMVTDFTLAGCVPAGKNRHRIERAASHFPRRRPPHPRCGLRPLDSGYSCAFSKVVLAAVTAHDADHTGGTAAASRLHPPAARTKGDKADVIMGRQRVKTTIMRCGHARTTGHVACRRYLRLGPERGASAGRSGS